MEKYSSYTIERIKCNPLIKGFLLLLETILWYIWRENLYIICEVNKTRDKIKEVKLTQEEKMEEFSQFKYVYATDTPNKYIVINSNKVQVLLAKIIYICKIYVIHDCITIPFFILFI